MRRLFAALLIPLMAVPALAQDIVPDRRTAISRDVDFYGGDLQNIFDTTLKACERACLSDPNCKAFTFNARSNACFPKSDITERVPYEGAFSAQVFETPASVKTLAKAQIARLEFLSSADFEAARSLAEGLARRYYAGDWTEQALIDGARARMANRDWVNAAIFAGAAITLGDRSEMWVELGEVYLRLEGSASNQRRYAGDALAAFVNAFLRSDRPAVQVNALAGMAEALERLERGGLMIPALRMAQSIRARDDLALRLERAIALHGFRVAETQVDSDVATPRICAVMNQKLVKVGVDYETFVQLPEPGLTVEAEGNQLCIGGVTHGTRYRIVLREGLPAANGEDLSKDTALTLYVRDRSPAVRFPGRAYVLPKAADAALPVETVNAAKLDLKLRRVSDRNLIRAIQDSYFGRPLSQWQEQAFSSEIAELIWEGTAEVGEDLNRDVTTRLPMGAALAGQSPGIYVLSARVPGTDPYDVASAVQWFVLSDLGVSTAQGADGLHVFVRALSDATAKAGVSVTLLSRANAVLGSATTDAEGYAAFPAGLTRGTGAAEPALLTVEEGSDDIAFLSLVDPAFDLSDRGVAGREPAGPVDLFLATDRGAYRAGDVIHATALARDDTARALDGLPLTAILRRPDGVEYARHFSAEGRAGGHVFAMPVGLAAPRGTWRLEIRSDPDAPALASQTLLVEDFLPERIDFDLALPEGPIRLGDTPALTIEARYLFGAPGGDLPVEGEVLLRAAQTLDAYPGYVFGRHDDPFSPRSTPLPGTLRTDAQGRVTAPIELPDVSDPGRPLEAVITARVAEGSGRPVERRLTRALAPAGAMIGLKPMFEDVVAEGAEAAFSVLGVGADLAPAPMRIRWTINRLTTRYQWYQLYGDWSWEPMTTRERVAQGEIALDAEPAQVSAPVDWGSYELVVERLDGPYAASSTGFYAGWYAPSDASDTPDTLMLSLDRPDYAIGDTAMLRIVPRNSGTALVTVMSNRLIHREVVEVSEGENLIPLTVTPDWGAGAYVSASVIRPMDVAAGRNPARALGIAHAAVAPGDKQLAVTLDAPAQSAPRGPLTVGLTVTGVAGGETAHVTLAAVDVGILNLTGFDSPDPSAHYFGQRKLGMGLRDVYGRLIDGMNGAMGTVRSGGDAMAEMRMESPPPTEDLVTFFSGPLTVGPDGRVETTLDIPEFNGTMRLMAVAWSPTGVGQAEAEVLVRDPVVVTASLPRFLAPGDTARMLLEIVHADGPAGEMRLELGASGLGLDTGTVPATITLTEGGKQALSVPVTAGDPGVHRITVALTTPGGERLEKPLTLAVQANDPEIARQSRFTLAEGDSFTFDGNVFAGLVPGTGSATLTVGPLARFDTPGLLNALDRYPYGCTEQVTSRALPLLYLDEVAQAMGLASRDQVALRIAQSIDRVLARQDANGSFGMWRPSSGNLWLDAYVTDFLSRAQAQGHDVPDTAFRMALDNLRNRVNYAPDFEEDGGDLAYALMVLAREGAAAMGDLRYYADVKADAFTTPLGAALLGAALASYGDPLRADAMFARADRLLDQRFDRAEARRWRADYGTNLRDSAAILTLAVEAGSTAVNRDVLATRLAGASGRRSTQEATWSLLAARALVGNGAMTEFTVNGAPVDGPFVHVLEAQTMGAALDIENGSPRDEEVTLTTFGVPAEPEPKGGNGYSIDRLYYTMDGAMADPSGVSVGTRLVTVIRVTPFGSSEARLIVDDPLPAGFEIDNPNLIRAGDIRALDWLKTQQVDHAEFRSDRFIAALDWRSDKRFELAYIVRAISPGEFHHPAASVEDMYRPEYRARTGTGRITVEP